MRRLTFDRRKPLYIEAMQAAAGLRHQNHLDPFSPICVFDLCEQVGVTVRFAAINMEGMYDRVPRPRIHLSSLRPFARRHFTCAHELGHHVFNHGTTIDQLKTDEASSPQAPEEILANSFASHLLMPLPGVKQAFACRGTNPEIASPAQLYAVACNFGVGYRTFVEYLSTSSKLITQETAARLRRWSPKAITSSILPAFTDRSLRIVDLHWKGRPIDAEQGDLLLCPADSVTIGPALSTLCKTSDFHLYSCVRPGISTLRLYPGAADHFVRVQPGRYVGLSRFRHLEEEVDD